MEPYKVEKCFVRYLGELSLRWMPDNELPRNLSRYQIKNEDPTWRRTPDGVVAAITFHQFVVDWERSVCTILYDEHRDCSYEHKQLTFAFELWQQYDPSNETAELIDTYVMVEQDYPTPIQIS